MDLAQFANKMEKRAQVFEQTANKIAIKAATAILKHLVNVTPVDTSQALSNWQVGINAPVNSEIPPYVAGKRGSTQTASAAKALSVGISALADKKAGETIYISNNLPYIEKLNAGSSTQNPGGFVEAAAQLGRKTVEKHRKK